MGVGVRNKVVLGFRVTKEDFFRSVTDKFKTCGQGHKAPDTHALFCSQDGQPFSYRRSLVPTPTLHVLLHLEGFDTNGTGGTGRTVVEQLHDIWVDNLNTGSHCFQYGGRTGEATYLCGVALARSHGYDVILKAMPWDTVLQKYQKVEELRNALGFAHGSDVRPIQLYSWLDYSC